MCLFAARTREKSLKTLQKEVIELIAIGIGVPVGVAVSVVAQRKQTIIFVRKLQISRLRKVVSISRIQSHEFSQLNLSKNPRYLRKCLRTISLSSRVRGPWACGVARGIIDLRTGCCYCQRLLLGDAYL